MTVKRQENGVTFHDFRSGDRKSFDESIARAVEAWGNDPDAIDTELRSLVTAEAQHLDSQQRPSFIEKRLADLREVVHSIGDFGAKYCPVAAGERIRLFFTNPEKAR